MNHYLFRCCLAVLLTGAGGRTFAQGNGSPNLPLMSHFNPYPAVGYNDCWGYTAPDGREYGLLGVNNGTSIVDLSEPDSPVEIGFIPTDTGIWKDIKTYQHYAYVVIDAIGDGLQIIDLADLPNTATLVNTYRGNGFGSSHNIFIDTKNGVLYAQGGRGVRIISLEDPVNPVQITDIPLFGQFDVHDIYVQNHLLYVAEGWVNSFSIFDVSDLANPILLQRFITPTAGYAHNCWATPDGRYLLTTEEVPENLTVKVWDISDLQNITPVDEYISGASNPARPHNVMVKGHYAYISHYWDGLRILDITDPRNVGEVGFYDTYPEAGSAFEGNWGVYPFFKSGKVLASDRTYGLFVLFFEGAIDSPTSVPPPATLPEHFALEQNYPNPFNPTTTIPYELAEDSEVRITIFDALGRKVRTLVQESQPANRYEVPWDATDARGVPVRGGIYFYRLEARGPTTRTSQIRRMIYLR